MLAHENKDISLSSVVEKSRSQACKGVVLCSPITSQLYHSLISQTSTETS